MPNLETIILVVLSLGTMLLVTGRALGESGRSGLFQILSSDEWKALAKVAAIALYALILMQADIPFELDAKMFIYGRF